MKLPAQGSRYEVTRCPVDPLHSNVLVLSLSPLKDSWGWLWLCISSVQQGNVGASACCSISESGHTSIQPDLKNIWRQNSLPLLAWIGRQRLSPYLTPPVRVWTKINLNKERDTRGGSPVEARLAGCQWRAVNTGQGAAAGAAPREQFRHGALAASCPPCSHYHNFTAICYCYRDRWQRDR